ncbi:MAG: hypothetical protein IT289_07435 [Oligoflexia bacterium]|nr:hypothetical protein [Oligoflexia bacterium]
MIKLILSLIAVLGFVSTAAAEPAEYPFPIYDCSSFDEQTQTGSEVGLSKVAPNAYEITVYDVDGRGSKVLKGVFSDVQLIDRGKVEGRWVEVYSSDSVLFGSFYYPRSKVADSYISARLSDGTSREAQLVCQFVR